MYDIISFKHGATRTDIALAASDIANAVRPGMSILADEAIRVTRLYADVPDSGTDMARQAFIGANGESFITPKNAEEYGLRAAAHAAGTIFAICPALQLAACCNMAIGTQIAGIEATVVDILSQHNLIPR